MIKPRLKRREVPPMMVYCITWAPWAGRPCCSYIGPGFTPATTARTEAGIELAGPGKDAADAAVVPPESTNPAAVAVDFDHGLTRLTATLFKIGTGLARIQSSAIWAI